MKIYKDKGPDNVEVDCVNTNLVGINISVNGIKSRWLGLTACEGEELYLALKECVETIRKMEDE